MCVGILAELEGLDLGDQRLNRRAGILLEDLASDSEASINAVSDGWAKTKAAFRFYNNKKVTPRKLMDPHRTATLQRIRNSPIALILQDTTEFDYSTLQPEGLGCLTSKKRRGFCAHVSLAATPDKLNLGVMDFEYYSRTPESLGERRKRRYLPIEEKESARWLRGYEQACRIANECPETQVISIADREGDIFEIYSMMALVTGKKADYIIRGDGDRSTTEPNRDAGPQAYFQIAEQVGKSDVLTTKTIDLPQTPKRSARAATVEIRAVHVAIRPPKGRTRLGVQAQNVVSVQEVGGPGDGTDVSWLLVTSLPIETMEQILKVIEYYKARWTIETFFRTLKSGCKVENIKLETADRIYRAVTMYMIVAWRVQYLTLMNRTVPNTPCTSFFTNSEWKAVWRAVSKKKLPKKVPRLKEMMELVARLGGHNNRDNDAAPGAECIWRGMRRVDDLALAWDAFGPEANRDVGN